MADSEYIFPDILRETPAGQDTLKGARDYLSINLTCFGNSTSYYPPVPKSARPGKCHLKLIATQSVCLFGSANLSRAAAKDNCELCMKIKDRSMIKDLWALAQDIKFAASGP
jgi:hypothetical protein